jgi:MaoC dehydratase-like protein
LRTPVHPTLEDERVTTDAGFVSVHRVDAAAEGKRYPDVAFDVTAGRVERFRAVFPGGGSGVPPTFLTVAEFAVFPTIVSDPDLGLDFSRVIHGDQEYAWHRQPMVGERLVAQARIATIRQRGSLGFLTIETEVVDGAGEPVARCRATMIERGEP